MARAAPVAELLAAAARGDRTTVEARAALDEASAAFLDERAAG